MPPALAEAKKTGMDMLVDFGAATGAPLQVAEGARAGEARFNELAHSTSYWSISTVSPAAYRRAQGAIRRAAEAVPRGSFPSVFLMTPRRTLRMVTYIPATDSGSLDRSTRRPSWIRREVLARSSPSSRAARFFREGMTG